MRVLKHGVVLVLVALVALTLAACGDDGGSSTEPATTQGQTQTTATVNPDGTLTVASAQGIPQLDPHRIVFFYEHILYPLLWNTLVDYTPDNGAEVQPALAESWDVSDDQKTYTFTLREGVRFHDGTPLTSEQVVGSLRRALDPRTSFIWAWAIPKVASIRATDERTVTIQLEAPSSASFLYGMTKIPIINPANVDEIGRSPVGTGPYRLTEFVPDERVVLERNPDYWGDALQLASIRIEKAQDTTAAVQSLEAGDLDALWGIPWPDVRRFEGGSDIKIVTGELPAVNILLDLDNTSEPFNDPKARLALAHATNKEAIIAAAYAGKGEVSPTNVPFVQGTELYDDSVAPIEYDLEKAEQLFREAGVERGTKLTYWAMAGQYDEWMTMGQILEQDLAKIGIELELRPVEANQWAGRVAPAGQRYPNLVVPNIASGLPAPASLVIWSPGICLCNYSDDRFAELLRAGDSAPLGSAERAQAYADVQKLMAEQVPDIIVGQTSFPIGTRSTVESVWIDPNGIPRFERAATTR